MNELGAFNIKQVVMTNYWNGCMSHIHFMMEQLMTTFGSTDAATGNGK